MRLFTEGAHMSRSLAPGPLGKKLRMSETKGAHMWDRRGGWALDCTNCQQIFAKFCISNFENEKVDKKWFEITIVFYWWYYVCVVRYCFMSFLSFLYLLYFCLLPIVCVVVRVKSLHFIVVFVIVFIVIIVIVIVVIIIVIFIVCFRIVVLRIAGVISVS